MEHGQKLYAAKTVSWPGATPFCPPVCGPNPLRGFGGHARPRYTRSARSFGILPRTNIQGRAWNSSNIVCRARVSTTKEVPLLKSPEPANRHAKVLRPHQGTSGAEDEALRRVPRNRDRHLDNVVRRICQTITSTHAVSRPDCFQPHEPFGVPMHSINRKPPMKLIRHDPCSSRCSTVMKRSVSSEFIPRLFRKWLATAKSRAFRLANFAVPRL